MPRLTIADIGRLPVRGMDAPGAIAFVPDGSALTWLQGDPGSLVRSLWRCDPATGERSLLAGPQPEAAREEALSHEERLRRERLRTSELGVTEYAWARDAMTLVVPMGGRVFVAAGEECRTGVRPLPGLEGVSCAMPSPDGTQVAVVQHGDLWVAPVSGGAARRLTEDAEPGVFNGLAEYAAAEELDRFEGLWWSRDSRWLAYAHVDERGVPPFVIGHLGDDEPFGEEHRYPFAGGPNAAISLRIVAVDGRATASLDLGMAPGDYLARVVAERSGGWLVAVLPRDQRSLRWLRVSPAGEAQQLWTERSDPWVNLDGLTRTLDDGWMLAGTEASGYRHLELRTPDGAHERQLTAGPWIVTGVAAVDEARGEVLFTGTRDGATERHLYVVSLDAHRPVEHPRRLTDEPGWHEIVASRDGARWTDTWSSLETAPATVLRGRDGEHLSLHEPTAAADVDLAPPSLVSVTAADGATPLDAALYLPTAEADAGPPPCVVWVYGGPHAQFVKRAWELTSHPLRQFLRQSGAAVLVVDNRGMANRGLAFEAVLDRQLGTAEVADQAAAVRQLAGRDLVDAARVGIVGGSYGGFMTLMAMIREPDLFRVGVAISPVTAWDGYDTAYTERYLGTPAAAGDAYRRSSPLSAAARLRGDLLVIHGALDENVHLRHSTRLVGVLQAAGLDVELVVLPHDRHRARSAGGVLTRDRRTVQHLLSGLGLPVPPEDVHRPAGEGPTAEAQAATGS